MHIIHMNLTLHIIMCWVVRLFSMTMMLNTVSTMTAHVPDSDRYEKDNYDVS